MLVFLNISMDLIFVDNCEKMIYEMINSRNIFLGAMQGFFQTIAATMFQSFKDIKPTNLITAHSTHCYGKSLASLFILKNWSSVDTLVIHDPVS